MKRIQKTKKINPTKYVNVETGESLYSEKGDIVSVNLKTELVTINSAEYVIIDSRAREYVEREFSYTEVGRIIKMCDMVKSCYNLLFDKKQQTYHTKQSLAKEIDYTRNNFANFMKKLYDLSIIYYMKGMKDGKEVTWIMLNPTLARKSRTVHEDCLEVFDDLRTKKVKL